MATPNPTPMSTPTGTPTKFIRTVPSSPVTRNCMICNRSVICCAGYYLKSYNGKGKFSSTIEQRVKAIVSPITDTTATRESSSHKLHTEYMCKKCFSRLNSVEKYQASISEFKQKYFETRGHYTTAVRTKRMIRSPSVSGSKRCDSSKSPKALPSKTAATERRLSSPRRKLNPELQKAEEKVRLLE